MQTLYWNTGSTDFILPRTPPKPKQGQFEFRDSFMFVQDSAENKENEVVVIPDTPPKRVKKRVAASQSTPSTTKKQRVTYTSELRNGWYCCR